MEPRVRISYQWDEEQRLKEGKTSSITDFTTGVSLHSHTSLSEESLTFIHQMALANKWMRRFLDGVERNQIKKHGYPLDFVRGNWRPPLVPKMAFDLEAEQIQKELGKLALVSISDHDTIQAPMLLRTVPSARHIPVSVEWSAPYSRGEFHLGIHNLPSETGQEWMERFARYTANPEPAELSSILRELHAIPTVLIVFNHPMWDLYTVGRDAHDALVGDFMVDHGAYIHAMELNGLRHMKENRAVVKLAQRWNQILISGGDRHGLEPNACVNLTNVTSFNDFVREIRVEKRSHVLFMNQYRTPWEQRILRSTLDATRTYPNFSEGWQRWDERAFHPDKSGALRQISELWPDGNPPRYLSAAIQLVHLLESRLCRSGLRFICANNDVNIGAGLAEIEIA